MKIKELFLGLLVTLNFLAKAQNSQKELLFTINEKPFYTDEFIRIYNKNLNLVKDQSQKDLDRYIDLYIGYKLKICKANDLGLQNNDKYKTELKGYRSQLAKNYATDSKVTNELVQEAYNRSLKEVKVSHILIKCDEYAPPVDTLKAFNEIKSIQTKILDGNDFGKLAKEFSQDPSAKENNGLLGYFSVFRMVYPFENAAYNTKKGEVSKIIRSRFGYHLIKVLDVRDNRGDLSIEHIMVLKPTTDSKEDKDKAEKKINDIYKKWQQGENFETLAKTYSEDKASSPKGGMLQRFGSGQLSSNEFEEMAFSLTTENPVSAPFQSQFGWHIAKLIDKFPIKKLEEIKSELEEKISKDERSRLITVSLIEKLKNKYVVKRDDLMYTKIQKALTNDFYEHKWIVPNSLNFASNLILLDNSPVASGIDFLNYIKSQEITANSIKPISKMVYKLYNNFVEVKLVDFYNSHLESEFPEFNNVVEEYRDGLLLFDLMEKEIWEKSKTDSIGLKKYYDLNKDRYKWNTRLDMVIFSSTNEKMIKNVKKMLKENQSEESINEAFNSKDVVNVISNNGIFEEGDKLIPKGIKMQEGISDIIKKDENYIVYKVNKVLPISIKTLIECKNKVINDFQQFLEENWVGNLKKEYIVKVNQVVFDMVKKEMKIK